MIREVLVGLTTLTLAVSAVKSSQFYNPFRRYPPYGGGMGYHNRYTVDQAQAQAQA